MKPIETVLCPVDFTTASDSARALASDVADAFGARLVLHHNLSGPAPGLGRGWEWERESFDDHETAARQAMDRALAEVPSKLAAEARLTRGPLFLVVRHLAAEVSADLVVLACHGPSSEDHASLTERFVRQSPCPVLAVGEAARRPWHPRFLWREEDPGEPLRILVATDLSVASNRAAAYAFEVARRLPLEIELVHVLPVDLRRSAATRAEETREARVRLRALVPGDLASRTHVRVVRGTPTERIPDLARDLGADLMVVGEHASALVRRLFTTDTTRALIHGAACPVWMVPAHTT